MYSCFTHHHYCNHLSPCHQRQRRQFKFYQENKPTSMTPERIVKLDQLGFAWDCRKNNTGTSKVVVSRANLDGIDIHNMNHTYNMVVAPAHIEPTQKEPISFNVNTVATLPSGLRSGGFPFPKFPTLSGGSTGSRSISAFKQQQQQRQQGSKDSQQQHQSGKSAETIGATRSGNGTAPGVTNSTSSKLTASGPAEVDVSKLPREFLSFSTRTFNKFPKINIPK
jgi:hypothetical protein